MTMNEGIEEAEKLKEYLSNPGFVSTGYRLSSTATKITFWFFFPLLFLINLLSFVLRFPFIFFAELLRFCRVFIMAVEEMVKK